MALLQAKAEAVPAGPIQDNCATGNNGLAAYGSAAGQLHEALTGSAAILICMEVVRPLLKPISMTLGQRQRQRQRAAETEARQ